MKQIITVLILALFSSCDPMRVLVVKTSSSPETSVTIYANTKITQDKEKTIITTLSSHTPPKRGIKLYYGGVGGWNISFVKEFSENIDSIIIINGNSKTILNNQIEINEYLIKHRYGYAKRAIKIEAK